MKQCKVYFGGIRSFEMPDDADYESIVVKGRSLINEPRLVIQAVKVDGETLPDPDITPTESKEEQDPERFDGLG